MVVVCPVVPEPPVTGGRKRTLRLLEAIAAQGGEPHLLTADDTGGDVAAIRARGWTIEVLPEAEPDRAARLAQHLARRPSPYLHGVARRLAELVDDGVAAVHLERTQSAYYEAPGVPTVLSTHNADADLLHRRAQGPSHRAPSSRARLHLLARATAHLEHRRLARMAAVICVSDDDATHVARLGGHALVAPNGVDGRHCSAITPRPRRSRPHGRPCSSATSPTTPTCGGWNNSPRTVGRRPAGSCPRPAWPWSARAWPRPPRPSGPRWRRCRRLCRRHRLSPGRRGRLSRCRCGRGRRAAQGARGDGRRPGARGDALRRRRHRRTARGRSAPRRRPGRPRPGPRRGSLADPVVVRRARAAAGRRRADDARWSRTLAPVVSAYRGWLGA